MKFTPSSVCAALLSVSATSVFAANTKYESMDYGRFLSTSVNNTEGKDTIRGSGKGCATDKGIAIQLGQKDAGTVVFDTDLLRMSGGWTQGFLKLAGVAFDGKHGPNPQPPETAQIIFQTNRTPGWSKGDDFEDPRKVPTGPGASSMAFGPLPKTWAKYKGLYLNGDDVVLSYSVAGADVLERPALEKVQESALITRTFNISGKASHAANLLAAEAPGESPVEFSEDGRVAMVQIDPKTPDARLFVAALQAPGTAKLSAVGQKVVLKLPAFTGGESFKVVYFRGTSADLPKLVEALKALKAPENLAALTQGGAPHWPETVTTQGVLGQATPASPYVVDTITPPSENPYKSWIRFGGLDFFKDGRIAASTWSGDVWIATGVDATLEKVTWKRYATGLFQALGLKIVDEQIYVLGRDQITRLKDLNGDGEADLYENFNNDVQVTPGFHEFAFDLQTDPAGNFFFSKGGPVNPGGRGWGPLSEHNGCILKVSKDGENLEVYATGVRAPNGLGMGPKGELTVGDNQGTWVPVDYIHEVKKGEFVSVPDLAHKDPAPTERPKHLCWIPYDWDNSCGSHVWNTSKQWGPLQGQMLYLSYGTSSLFNVIQERIDGVSQGALVRFPLQFESGIQRARFSPIDGQLYVAGIKGWQTNGAKDACLQRVRYTGQSVCMQNAFHVTDKGIHIGFTSAVDPQTAGDVENYSLQISGYRWTSAYGSAEYKVSDPETKGRDDLTIKSVQVSADKKSVFLEVADLKPVDQFRIKMNIKSAEGQPVPAELAGTINGIAPDSKPGITYTSLQ